MTVEIVGPFKSHIVLVDGRRVPYLTATPESGGRVVLTADERFHLDLPVADSDRVTEFIAFCIAVASGYTAHPSADMPGPVLRHPFGRCVDVS